ncbi:MAG: hypothetical protein Q9160_007693 [Pyrenula sp. 1 TL-2023]
MDSKVPVENEPRALNLSDVLSGSVPDFTERAALHCNAQDIFGAQSRPQQLLDQRGAAPSASIPRDIQGRFPLDRPKSYDLSTHAPAAAGLKLLTHLKYSPSSPALPSHLLDRNNTTVNGHSPQWSISSTGDSSPLYMADDNQRNLKKQAFTDEDSSSTVHSHSSSPTLAVSAMLDRCSVKEDSGAGLVINKTMPQHIGRPSVKHLTCYWWKVKGACRFNEKDCLYAHHDTGKIADAPRHLGPGEKAVAGRNLENRLAQYVPHTSPLNTPTPRPSWMATEGLGYVQAANPPNDAFKRSTASSDSLSSMQHNQQYPTHLHVVDQSMNDNTSTHTPLPTPSTGRASTPLVIGPGNETPSTSGTIDYHPAPTHPPSPVATPTNRSTQAEIRDLRKDKVLLENLLISSNHDKETLQRDKDFLQEQFAQHTVDKQFLHAQLMQKQVENQNFHKEIQGLREALSNALTEKKDLQTTVRDQANTIEYVMRRDAAHGSLRTSASVNSFLPLPSPGPIERPKSGSKRMNSSG